MRADGVAGFAEGFGQLLIYFSSIFSLLSYVCGTSNIIARPHSEAGEEAAGKTANGKNKKKKIISINLNGRTNARTQVRALVSFPPAVETVQNSKFSIVYTGAARCPAASAPLGRNLVR